MESTKQKYDWPSLKQEFFISDYVEVKSFFEEQYGNYSGTIRTNTSGWSKEKKQFVQDILVKSIEHTKEKRALELSKTLDGILDELQRRVNGSNIQFLSVRELKTLWEIFMRMNNKSVKANEETSFLQSFCEG
tara:strand:+ start:87 stop:485 length:399 start_codon:yes stop_codon:yes gene_type:complete